MDSIKILVTLDQNYVQQLQVMLTSLKINNPGEEMELYLMHSSISEEFLHAIEKQCRAYGYTFVPVHIDGSFFVDAPTTKQYPREMYYRLLAPHLLSDDLNRILYLDPDILVINPLRPLWQMDMKGHLFAAAPHTGKTELANTINRARLGTQHKYFNSGVLLIDLAAGRTEIVARDIFCYTQKHGRELLLPDQDLLNVLYGKRTLELDDSIWNYDARNYNNYLLRSSGVFDLNWVMGHTVILHFCGKAKPWKPRYIYRFGVLYKHYEQITKRSGFLV